MSVYYVSPYYQIGGVLIYAQEHEQEQEVKPEKQGYTGKDRWAYKTNVIDWAATIPNFTAEYDISDSYYNRMTASLTVRYNWNTYHTRLPYNVFNVMQFRPEVRYYWHFTNDDNRITDDEGNIVKWPVFKEFKRWLNDYLLVPERPDAKTWQAHYIGAYMDGGAYSVKFGEYGYQGTMFSLGVSTGFGTPMYQYKTGFIDIELGFSLGLMLATSKAYILDGDANIYRHDYEKSRGLHLVPFPVVSQLSLSFAWRSVSIEDKYKQTDNAARRAARAEREAKKEARAAAKAAKAAEKAKKEEGQNEEE